MTGSSSDSPEASTASKAAAKAVAWLIVAAVGVVAGGWMFRGFIWLFEQSWGL